MMPLDALQVSTLLALLDSEKPLSAQRLGERVGISARALRYRLPLLQAWLMRQGAELVIRPRRGLYLRASPEVRRRLHAELQQTQPTPLFRAEERVLYIEFLLLTEPEGISAEALQAKLGISRATLLRDLRQVETRLNAKGLVLKRLRQQGFRLLGPEVAQRHFLLEILLNSGLNEVLTDLSAHGKILTPSLTFLQQALLDEVKTWNLTAARRFVTRVERELGLTLRDDDLLFLTLYWALALQRLQGGNTVSRLERPVEVLISTQEYTRLEAVIASFLSANGIPIPRDEIFQFLVEIKACQGELTLATQPAAPDETELSRQVAEAMLKRISERLGYDLCHADILDQMALHLARALARLRAGLPLYNPLTQEIQQAYPHLWVPSVDVARQVGAQYGLVIPEEEVAYLVMYLALAVQLAEQSQRRRIRVVVACPTGGVMARLLVYRLQSALPDIEVVESVSLRQLSRVDLGQVDLVVTTVKIAAGRLPVVTVNPLLGEEDLQRIRSQIAQLQTRRNSSIQKEREVCR